MLDARTCLLTDTLRDGTVLTIRAVRPDDRERVEAAFRNLDRETVYSRFFTFKDHLTATEVTQITTPDFLHDVVLIATIGGGPQEIIIGIGGYTDCSQPDGRSIAEVAFVVEEDYQGLGIATRIMRLLTQIALDRGVAAFEADVLSANHPMLAVFARSALPMRTERDGSVVRVALSLVPHGAA